MIQNFGFRKGLVIPALSIASLALLASCASALKKKCNATNWFDYGTEIAHHGTRPDADSFVKDCQKEKADIQWGDLDKGFKRGMSEYCVPDYAFIVGKRGEFLNLDLCDFNLGKTLTDRHKAGVLQFCAKDNGYSFGSTGKVYNQICPPDLEKAFLPEYRRGRKAYLLVVVTQKNRDAADIDRQVADIQRQISSHQANAARIDRSIQNMRMQNLAPDVKQKKINSLESDASSERSTASSLEYEITRKRKAQSDLKREAEDAEREAVSMGN